MTTTDGMECVRFLKQRRKKYRKIERKIEKREKVKDENEGFLGERERKIKDTVSGNVNQLREN